MIGNRCGLTGVRSPWFSGETPARRATVVAVWAGESRRRCYTDPVNT
ncbi:hypothetical protein BZL29_8551 [Mycobacterium kansasii]|uniref:Uncharacterized protein n=1 Tax=Mycobacterium kansasii TaxID=1768 RepID=A0A1V3W9G8_MYCKA|nr:hypothetical protein BZL29_8551 [Mycobacterium kansasii]